MSVPFNDAAFTSVEEKPPIKGEYEVTLDAVWPNSGMVNAIWNGRSWKTLNGEKVKIKGWREIIASPVSELMVDDSGWSTGVTPTKKGLYEAELLSPGASIPVVLELKWTGKKWIEDDQFEVDLAAVSKWRAI